MRECNYFLTKKKHKIIIMDRMTKKGTGTDERVRSNLGKFFNKCPRNQMRDVFVEEVEIADPEAYVKQKFQGKDVSYEKTVLEDGTINFLTFRHL